MKIYLFFKIVLLFLLLLLLQFLIALSLIKILGVSVNYANEVALFSINASFFIVIIIMVKMWRIDVRKLFKKISLKHIVYLLVIGVLIKLVYPMFNISNLLNNISIDKTGIMMPSNYFFDNENFWVSKPFYLLHTLLLMPFLEEILYRGIIQNRLTEKFSAVWAILLSSLLFAIGHMDFEQSITTFFGGLIIGYIYHKSKNLTSVVLLHAFINAFVLFFKIEYDNSVSVSILLYHFILIALLVFISKKYPKKLKKGVL